jgi:hypothetical protein
MFSHDCALLRPVANGAGIILVVDGSKRIKEKDRTEMELLRLTGRPRMAILNNLTKVDKHMPAWQDALNKSFNSVREFNAHRATYAERIALLGALKTIDQRWEPMLDRPFAPSSPTGTGASSRAPTASSSCCKEALSKRVTRVVKVDDIVSEGQREAIQQQLTLALQQALRQFEVDAQQAIRKHFRHNVWDLPPNSLLAKDLFSEEVDSALGLKQRQLAVAGAAAGALSGGAIDVGLGGCDAGRGGPHRRRGRRRAGCARRFGAGQAGHSAHPRR